MIHSETFPCSSPLLSAELEAQLTEAFKKLTTDITLISIIDTNNEKCTELAIFLRHVARLCDHLHCVFFAHDECLDLQGEHPQAEALFASGMLPVVGIFKGKAFCRVAFHGIPGGKEINAFVMAIFNAAGDAKSPSDALLNDLQKYKTKTEILICVSLYCHHCAGVVMECQRLAILNENISASMIDANLFPELVKEYALERVPMIVINKKHILMGNQSAEQVLHYLNTMD